MKKTKPLRLLKLLGLAVAAQAAVGCVSLERLVDVPAEPGLTRVETYNTELHQQSIHIFNPVALDNRVKQLHLQPRVDNLFFLIDQSPALSGEFRGVDTRFYAREMVRRFARTMPQQSYSGAALIYEHNPNSQRSRPELTRYSNADLEAALKSPGSMQRLESDSLAMAIEQLSGMISSVEGSSALILVTPWAQVDESVERAVMRLRQRSRFETGLSVIDASPEASPWQGSQSGICLYTLGVGNKLSRNRLETVDSCGFSVAANKVSQPRDMAHFVQTVLYKGPADSDGDGIYDYLDRCPNTSPGRIVDYSGCLRFAANEGGNQQ